MTETWQKAIDDNKVVGVLFIDFKKAFDCVSHEVLKKKLLASGISGDLHSLISNYLANRVQYTCVNDKISNIEDVEYGVPQGSLLGPRLFSIDANDLPDKVIDGETEMFADDSTSFCITNTFDKAFTKVQLILDQVNQWAISNGLTIHTDKGKTEIMFLSRQTFIGPFPNFQLNTNNINVTDCKMSWFKY